MTDRSAGVLAGALFAVAVALASAHVVLQFLTRDVPIEAYGVRGFEVVFAVVFGAVGALIARRRPQNPIGWSLLAGGLVGAFQGFAAQYATLSFVEHDRTLPLTDEVAWLQNWSWLPLIALAAILPFLLFPTGRLLSTRWRPAVWMVVAGVGVFGAGVALDPGQLQSLPFGFHNPFAASASVTEALASVGSVLFMIGAVSSVVAVALRFRRSSGDEREQLKWLLYASAFVALAMGLNSLFGLLSGFAQFSDSALDRGLALFTLTSLIMVAVAMGVAILKYRLYDIDVVINRTLVFGILAAFITLVYVGIVVGIGNAIGRGDEPNVGLSILATAVVAVAFQPLRERARHLANRLVYGKRATPYEILSDFAERMAGTYSAEDVLPQLARTITEGTGAARGGVWLRVGSGLRPAASWPGDADSQQPIELAADQLPVIPGADRSYPVRHQGELLGALTVTKPPGEPMSPAEDKLLTDLASQAGLVLRNARLIEEIRSSRQRLVAAQDVERRRLERNIHDGAQQQLVALGVKLGLMKSIGAKDPEAALRMLDQLQGETQEALETLRDLARGIYPPLLADHGLTEALRSQLRKIPLPVQLAADGVGRFAQEIEAAVYFCCLEALQNVAKYAGASMVSVRLAENDGALTFAVSDDGVGFDPARTPRGSGLTNMEDRLAALGGSLDISSASGRGTIVTGRLPATERLAGG